MSQCAVVCCSVLQRVAAGCSVSVAGRGDGKQINMRLNVFMELLARNFHTLCCSFTVCCMAEVTQIEAHIQKRHVTCMSESYHTEGLQVEQRLRANRKRRLAWRNHVTYTKQSRQIYERVMSPTRKSLFAYTKESWHINERVISHIQKSHVAYTKESCHTYERAMSQVRKSRVTCMSDASWHFTRKSE